MMNQKQVRLMVIVITAVIFLSSQTQSNIFFPLSSIGYSFGGAGVRASFVGIEWNYKDASGQSDLRPDTKFYFDADQADYFAPNLVGEMTNAFVPEETLSNVPSWVPTQWFMGSTDIKNPLQTETWELENPDNPDEILAYEIEEWMLKLYVSVTCEWDDGPVFWDPNQEWADERYRDTELWIELDLAQDFFVFEGSPTPYFAISKVKCSDFAKGKLGYEDNFFQWEKGLGLVDEPKEYTPTDLFSVVPASTSWMYLYYDQWGQEKATDVDPFTYRGRQLNPDIFVDKMFFSVNLANFGTQHTDFIGGSSLSKGDAVTWEFDVYVYVVGEWKIKDVSELPVNYGREPMVTYQESWVTGMLTDPRFQLWSFIGIIALVVCVLAIFAPWVLFALVGLFKSGKR